MGKYRINRESAAAMVVDFQEKLMPAIAENSETEQTAAKLIQGLRALEIPMLVSQQYTKGLGGTVAGIAEALGDFEPVDKNTFSVLDSAEIKEKLEKTGAEDIILFGVETHICIEQSALDMLSAGFNVFLIADCCSSRQTRNSEIALERMRQAGVVVTTYEAILYEMMGSSKAEAFKAVSAIVK